MIFIETELGTFRTKPLSEKSEYKGGSLNFDAASVFFTHFLSVCLEYFVEGKTFFKANTITSRTDLDEFRAGIYELMGDLTAKNKFPKEITGMIIDVLAQPVDWSDDIKRVVLAVQFSFKNQKGSERQLILSDKLEEQEYEDDEDD